MQYLNKAYLLIGGNIGNRFFHLQQAERILNEQCGTVVNKSAVYETAAWGNLTQGAFLNQALELDTEFSAVQLMPRLLTIEEQMGRKRLEKYGPRIIDIDILLFNEEVHETDELTVPHPQLQNRLFALQPLSDIGGTLLHPVLKKTIQQLLSECTDTLEVKKIKPGYEMAQVSKTEKKNE